MVAVGDLHGLLPAAIQLTKKRDATAAKRQREAVRAIASSGGIVLYDFQDDSRYVDKDPTDTRSAALVWVHAILGADMFADVVQVIQALRRPMS